MSVFNVFNEALVGVEWGFSQVLVFVQVRFQLVNILFMCVYQVFVCVCLSAVLVGHWCCLILVAFI